MYGKLYTNTIKNDCEATQETCVYHSALLRTSLTTNKHDEFKFDSSRSFDLLFNNSCGIYKRIVSWKNISIKPDSYDNSHRSRRDEKNALYVQKRRFLLVFLYKEEEWTLKRANLRRRHIYGDRPGTRLGSLWWIVMSRDNAQCRSKGIYTKTKLAQKQKFCSD